MSRARRIAFALAGLLVTACSGDSTIAPPSDPAERVSIAFAYSSPDVSTATDIFVIATDKSNLRRIVSDSSAYALPDWSPDGKTLLFTRAPRPGVQASLWVVKADGSGLRALPSGPGGSFGGRWSPDGQSIVYVSFTATGGSLGIMRADGTDRHTIANPFIDGVVSTPTWSRDGRIAFARSIPGVQGIWTVKPDGSELTQLTKDPNDGEPRWSPDGTRLALTSTATQGIMVVNAEGLARRVVTSGAADQAPTWSPDGRWLLFDRHVSSGLGSSCPLYKVPSVGGFAVALLPERTRGFCAGSAWRDVPGVTY